VEPARGYRRRKTAGGMWPYLVYSVYDLGHQDVSDAADDRDEVEHVPRVTEVVLRQTHRHTTS